MKNVSVYDKMTNAEKEVAQTLKELGIKWRYEHPIFIWDENMRPRVWAPDFYLVPFGIYIEVCGSKDFNYEYRKKIFSSNDYFVIFLHLYKESDKWINHLIKYLKFYIENRSRKMNELLHKDN